MARCFVALLANEGPGLVNQILNSLSAVARQHRTGWQPDLNTPYANTILSTTSQKFPGDIQIEERLTSIMRSQRIGYGGAC
jgi:pyruvate dehydrogenase E1 component